jgi:hypothetical protein
MKKATTYDKEIEAEFEEYIQQGVIEICNPNAYFIVIEDNFPMGLNRIAWEKVKEHHFLDLSNISTTKEQQKRKVVHDFFRNVEQMYPIIAQKKFIIIGDNALHQGYKMGWDIVQKSAHFFIDYPQHTYIIEEEGTICINYTFEDELYFGLKNR